MSLKLHQKEKKFWKRISYAALDRFKVKAAFLKKKRRNFSARKFKKNTVMLTSYHKKKINVSFATINKRKSSPCCEIWYSYKKWYNPMK